MNRDVFLLNFHSFVAAYDKLHRGFGTLAQGLRSGRDAFGKSHVSFIPFLALIQRQILAAFDHLASFQAYQAWTMCRPALEIPLIMGKWIDDEQMAGIWKRRETDQKAYQQEYSGKKLRSKSLPRSDEIQGVLKTINDAFVHPNPFYYHRHLLVAQAPDAMVSIEIDYFDLESEIESHVLAFLHLIAVVHDSVRAMLINLVALISDSVAIRQSIVSNFESRVVAIGAADPTSGKILFELGCWPAPS